MSTIYYNASIFDGRNAEITRGAWFEVTDSRINQMGTGKPSKLLNCKIK